MIWVPKQPCHKTPLLWYKSYGKKLLRRGWLDRLSPHYFCQYFWKFYCLEIETEWESGKEDHPGFPSALQSYNWKHTEAGHLGSPRDVHKLNIDMIPKLEGSEGSSRKGGLSSQTEGNTVHCTFADGDVSRYSKPPTRPMFSFYKWGNMMEGEEPCRWSWRPRC